MPKWNYAKDIKLLKFNEFITYAVNVKYDVVKLILLTIMMKTKYPNIIKKLKKNDAIEWLKLIIITFNIFNNFFLPLN